MIISVRQYSPESGSESSLTRLSQSQKAEFTSVIEHFWLKSNEVSGLYGQTLTKNLGKCVAAAFLVAACGGAQTTSEEIPHDEGSGLLTNQIVQSTLWFQTSEEAIVIYEQTYDYAMLRLQENLSGTSDDQRPALIIDLDETVLDNSPYEARLVLDEEEHTPAGWAQWVTEEKAGLLPGAGEFLRKAAEKNVEIFYISNRSEDLLEPTLHNLRQFDLPYTDEEHIFLKSETSDKTARRSQVKESHRVVLVVGDQLTDFAQDYEEYLYEGTMRDSLMQYFVLLPNPMYGDFSSKPYNNEKLPARERALIRKEALDPKR